MKQSFKIGFIGLGLIGGSIAKAIRLYFPTAQIVAFDKDKKSLALAISEDIIDNATTSIDDNFRNCNFIFLCAPVKHNNAYLKILTDFLWDDLIITDVGSVKSSIHKEVDRLGLQSYFIGGHPMAGSEKSGFENARPQLIENAFYILTAESFVAPEKVERYQTLLQSIKSIPISLDYEEHDFITGTISHLPHILAASLVNFVKTSDNEDETMKYLAAGGFKDITRIASSSPVMWQQICTENNKIISMILEKYIDQLTQFKFSIEHENRDKLFQNFQTAKNYRDSFSTKSTGPINRNYCIYCDIKDETGQIATIATLLASNNISIKNIGIVHNREFEEGVLRIEFYDLETSTTAAVLLDSYHYVTYSS